MTDDEIIDLALKTEMLVPFDLAAGPAKQRAIAFARAVLGGTVAENRDAARYRKLRTLIVNRATGKHEAEWSAFIAAGLAVEDDQLDAALDSITLRTE